MSRLTVITPLQWLQLLAGLALACAVLVVGFSGASFTSQSQNPSNTISAGTLTMTNSKTGTSILTASALKPGGAAVVGTVTVTNSSSYAVTGNLRALNLSSTPASPALAANLNLLVEDITATPTTVWTGTLSALPTTGLGTFTAGQTRTFRLTLTWPAANNNPSLQAARSDLTFRWTLSS